MFSKTALPEIQFQKCYLLGRLVQLSGVTRRVGAATLCHIWRLVAATWCQLSDCVRVLQVIKENRVRTPRWVSSSIPEDRWDSELAKYSSADYHVNNLVSPVLFQEALQHVPAGAILIEIAPHCLLQAILKRSLSPDCLFVGLMKRNHADNVEYLLSSLGK